MPENTTKSGDITPNKDIRYQLAEQGYFPETYINDTDKNGQISSYMGESTTHTSNYR